MRSIRNRFRDFIRRVKIFLTELFSVTITSDNSDRFALGHVKCSNCHASCFQNTPTNRCSIALLRNNSRMMFIGSRFERVNFQISPRRIENVSTGRRGARLSEINVRFTKWWIPCKFPERCMTQFNRNFHQTARSTVITISCDLIVEKEPISRDEFLNCEVKLLKNRDDELNGK